MLLQVLPQEEPVAEGLQAAKDGNVPAEMRLKMSAEKQSLVQTRRSVQPEKELAAQNARPARQSIA
jgi:hypothetical protein